MRTYLLNENEKGLIIKYMNDEEVKPETNKKHLMMLKLRVQTMDFDGEAIIDQLRLLTGFKAKVQAEKMKKEEKKNEQ